jgi:hypothetical protein
MRGRHIILNGHVSNKGREYMELVNCMGIFFWPVRYLESRWTILKEAVAKLEEEHQMLSNS